MLFSLIKIYYHHQIPIHIAHFAHSSTNALVLMYGPEIEIEIWILLFRLRLHRASTSTVVSMLFRFIVQHLSISLTLTLFKQLHHLIDTAFYLRWHHDELSSSPPPESIHNHRNEHCYHCTLAVNKAVRYCVQAVDSNYISHQQAAATTTTSHQWNIVLQHFAEVHAFLHKFVRMQSFLLSSADVQKFCSCLDIDLDVCKLLR